MIWTTLASATGVMLGGVAGTAALLWAWGAVRDLRRRHGELRAMIDQAKRVAARRVAILEAVDLHATACGLCGAQPDLLQLVEFYDDASWLCTDCARLFVAPRKEAA